MRPTLALALLTKNEANNLPVLFETIEGCFDKIYLTDDTKTTDNTIDIAENFGCITQKVEWSDDFSHARNISFEPVKEDYIMWMDADDVLTDKDKFIYWRDNFMGTRDLWMVPYYYVPGLNIERERVVKSSHGMKWKYFVHECIDVKPILNSIRCGRVHDWSVFHLRTEFESSNERNLRLFELNKTNLCSRMKWAYGKELYASGRNEEAKPYLSEALLDEKLDAWDREQCIKFLALC